MSNNEYCRARMLEDLVGNPLHVEVDGWLDWNHAGPYVTEVRERRGCLDRSLEMAGNDHVHAGISQLHCKGFGAGATSSTQIGVRIGVGEFFSVSYEVDCRLVASIGYDRGLAGTCRRARAGTRERREYRNRRGMSLERYH